MCERARVGVYWEIVPFFYAIDTWRLLYSFCTVLDGMNDLEKMWKRIKRQALLRWPQISETDLENLNGSREGLIQLLQEKLLCSRHEAITEFDNFLYSLVNHY